MQSISRSPLHFVAAYYDSRVREFGPAPWGVDWTCELTQQLRFIQLLKIVGRRRSFSINDMGCGYGALLPFLRDRFGPGVEYTGIDVAAAMIDSALHLHGREGHFVVGNTLPRVADFSVASGIFNVQLGHAPARWRGVVREALWELHRGSRLGFAVNFLQPASRGLVPLDGLYRARPEYWADYCRREFGVHVEVVRHYGLREFTLLARRQSIRMRRQDEGV